MIFVCVIFALPADDKRSACFVDENGVDFVNDTKVESALNFAIQIYLHIVAQVIKTELVIGSVGYIAVVGGFARIIIHIGKNRTDSLTQIRIYGAHPRRVAFGKVVVDSYNVHALFRKTV